MFNLTEKLKHRLYLRRLIKEAGERRRSGYNWAAGLLLMGELTPEDLRRVSEEFALPMRKGVLDAVDRYEALMPPKPMPPAGPIVPSDPFSDWEADIALDP
jgi:hypothetical protein